MKIYLVYLATGQHNDRLMSVHATKRSALLWKQDVILNGHNHSIKVSDYRDFYVVEKYVLNIAG